jgi:hypothetical protein
LLDEIGFVDVTTGPAMDTFAGAQGEANARTFDVYGYAFLAHKPDGEARSPSRARSVEVPAVRANRSQRACFTPASRAR